MPTNHNPATGLTVTATRSIDGAAFASGTIANMTEVASGLYQCDLAAGDLNGNDVPSGIAMRGVITPSKALKLASQLELVNEFE